MFSRSYCGYTLAWHGLRRERSAPTWIRETLVSHTLVTVRGIKSETLAVHAVKGSTLKCLVGSKNPAKVKAAAAAIKEAFPKLAIDIEGKHDSVVIVLYLPVPFCEFFAGCV
jgi:hypothetical protein